MDFDNFTPVRDRGSLKHFEAGMERFGTHYIVDFEGADPDCLDDRAWLERGMEDAAERAGARVVTTEFHGFSPTGVTGFLLLQESHFAIHTWPEQGYAAVDLFGCGTGVDPSSAFHFLKDILRAGNYEVRALERGIAPDKKSIVSTDREENSK